MISLKCARCFASLDLVRIQDNPNLARYDSHSLYATPCWKCLSKVRDDAKEAVNAAIEKATSIDSEESANAQAE